MANLRKVHGDDVADFVMLCLRDVVTKLEADSEYDYTTKRTIEDVLDELGYTPAERAYVEMDVEGLWECYKALVPKTQSVERLDSLHDDAAKALQPFVGREVKR